MVKTMFSFRLEVTIPFVFFQLKKNSTTFIASKSILGFGKSFFFFTVAIFSTRDYKYTF